MKSTYLNTGLLMIVLLGITYLIIKSTTPDTIQTNPPVTTPDAMDTTELLVNMNKLIQTGPGNIHAHTNQLLNPNSVMMVLNNLSYDGFISLTEAQAGDTVKYNVKMARDETGSFPTTRFFHLAIPQDFCRYQVNIEVYDAQNTLLDSWSATKKVKYRNCPDIRP